MLRDLRNRFSYSNVTATVALVAALGGGAYAAFDPIGSDGDVDACFERKSGDLDLLKGKKCGKGEKRVTWSEAGPEGPEGPPGPPGADGQTGATGAPGSARAYGFVSAAGGLSNSANASVSKPATGRYCVSVPGVSDTTSPILLSLDSNLATVGTASIVDAADPLTGTGSQQWFIYWGGPDSGTCPSPQFQVEIFRQELNTATNQLSVTEQDHAFTFLVP
jgi:hypothetical protein